MQGKLGGVAMDDTKAPITRPAQAESLVKSELDRLERRVDLLWDGNHEALHKTGALATIMIALLVGVVAAFAAGLYDAEKTSERLKRLERINGIDEIGRRK